MLFRIHSLDGSGGDKKTLLLYLKSLMQYTAKHASLLTWCYYSIWSNATDHMNNSLAFVLSFSIPYPLNLTYKNENENSNNNDNKGNIKSCFGP